MATPKLLHIFKPGRWTAMNGQSVELSQADLEATAKAYDPTLHKAPLVVGHPRTDDPAKGWVKSLVVTDKGLFAEPMKVDPAFAEEVNAGRWGTISVKLYRPTDRSNPVPGVWYPRHVGFLGAQPPGVKGLEEPAFSEGDESDEDGGVCFQQGIPLASWGMDTSASLFRRIREFLLAQFGQATADQVVPDWEIESLREAARQEPATPATPAFSEGDPQADPAPAGAPPANPPIESPQPEEKDPVSPEEKAALEAENARLKQQLQEAQAATKAAEGAQHLAFAEQLISEGRLAPKNKGVVVALLNFTGSGTSDDGSPMEFGEGDDKQPLLDAFKAFLSQSPKVVEFGEIATKARAAGAEAGQDAEVEFGEADPERLKQHQAVLAHMEAHKVDYATAARAVIR